MPRTAKKPKKAKPAKKRVRKAPTGRAHRCYGREEQTAALAALQANGGDLSLTSKQTGVPLMTLHRWARGSGLLPGVTVDGNVKITLADAIEEVAWEIIGAMPGKVPFASLKDAAISLGIAVEKTRLLREQPTSLTGKAEMTDDEFARRLNVLAAGVRSRLALAGGTNGARPAELGTLLPDAIPLDPVRGSAGDGVSQPGP